MAGTHGAATVPVMFGYRHSPELAFWVVAVSVVGVVALIEALLGGCAAPGAGPVVTISAVGPTAGQGKGTVPAIAAKWGRSKRARRLLLRRGLVTVPFADGDGRQRLGWAGSVSWLSDVQRSTCKLWRSASAVRRWGCCRLRLAVGTHPVPGRSPGALMPGRTLTVAAA